MRNRKTGMLGARERRKSEKMERIRNAALELFNERGYDLTTMRDVAKMSHVALGTVSLYASDKKELGLLVTNRIIDEIAFQAWEDAIHKRCCFEDRLVLYFGRYYEEWERFPNLCKIFVQTSTYSGGRHGDEYVKIRQNISRHIEILVWDAIKNKELSTTEDVVMTAQYFFLLFSGALRWWIANENPIAAEGIAYFRRLVNLQITRLDSQKN